MERFLAFTGVLGLIWLVFNATDSILGPGRRRIIADWLRGSNWVDWPDGFISLYDWVFKPRHSAPSAESKTSKLTTLISNWKARFIFNIWPEGVKVSATRSMVMSLISVTLFISILIYDQKFEIPITVDVGWFVFLALILNFIPDYISLLETRLVLKYMSKSKSISTLLILIVIDFISTIFVFYLAYICFIFIIGVEIQIVGHFFLIFDFLYSYFFPPSESILRHKSLFGAFVCSTILTSVWLWLYLISGTIIRFLLHMKPVAIWVQVDAVLNERPMSVIGYCLMVIATLAFVGLEAYRLLYADDLSGLVQVSRITDPYKCARSDRRQTFEFEGQVLYSSKQNERPNLLPRRLVNLGR